MGATMRFSAALAATAVLCGVLGLSLWADRTAPTPEGLPDPASMQLELRPGAYFPKDFPLHGKVRLLSSPIAEAGQRQRVQVEYEVGARGVAQGEAIEIWKHFTSDFEEFQTDSADRPAYISAETTAPGVRLTERAFTNWIQRNKVDVFPYRKTAAVVVETGSLREGDKVVFDLGGRQGVRMQHYQENLFNFRFAITDAETQKVQAYCGDAYMKVIGGEAESLRVYAQPVLAAGTSFRVEVVPVDGWGSLAQDYQGLELSMSGARIGPAEFEYDPELMHYVADGAVAVGEGTTRIDVSTPDGRLSGTSHPIWIERTAETGIYYGDLHQHAYLQDGRGVFDELYLNARRVGMLDFGAVTPHHMWINLRGPLYRVDDYPAQVEDSWPAMIRSVKTFKGWKGFVPILGYEYSVGTRKGGHHNVVFREDEAPTTMHINPRNPMEPVGDMLQTLRQAEAEALVIPHVGGGPPDWEHPTDPRVERLYEIASVHGVFEESWQAHLAAGLRLAATASADNHTVGFGNSYPGLIYTMTNPLTAVFATSRDRDAIWEGLYQRRTFATTGNQRMLLRFSLDGEPMGGELPRGHIDRRRLTAKISGTAPLTRLDILKNNEILHSISPARNRGRILRVKWGSNFYQRRSNIGLADGSLTPSAGRLQLIRPLHLDVAFEHIGQNGDAIHWRTAAVSNDREALLADLSGVTGDSLMFEIDEADFGPMEVRIPLSQLREKGFFAWSSRGHGKAKHSYLAKMGVEPRFFLEAELINPEAAMDFEFAYEERTEPKPGDYYYLRVEQLDTNLAWSSPIWIN